MRFNKYIAMGIAAFILLIVIIVAVNTEPDVTGQYIVKVNGKYTGTTARIVKTGNAMEITMEGLEGLHARYTVKTVGSGAYSINDMNDYNKDIVYHLKRVGAGLQGTAYILPIGKIDILFEKKGDLPRKERTAE